MASENVFNITTTEQAPNLLNLEPIMLLMGVVIIILLIVIIFLIKKNNELLKMKV